MIPQFFRNPFNIAAAVMLVAATILFVNAAFAGEPEWRKDFRAPAAVEQISPNVICYLHKEAKDIEHNVDLILENDENVEIVDDIRPHEGFDGFVEYIVKVDDKDIYQVWQWRWINAQKLMCAKLVDTVKLGQKV